jgi:hypothetical protein
MKEKYSLYELIKDKLSPVTRKKLEYQMHYKELKRKEGTNEGE